MYLIHFSSFLESLHCALNLKARLFKFHLVFACHAVFARSRLLIVQLKTDFFASHIDFSPFIQVEAVVNFYQIGFLPHKESPPGTFQPLSPSRGLATQLQHILSGLEFRLFLNKIFHIFLFFAEKFEIGRSSCLFQLFWYCAGSNRRIKLLGNPFWHLEICRHKIPCLLPLKYWQNQHKRSTQI